MLTSLIINLQSATDITLPASLGRAGQALFLSLIQERDPDLSKALHQGQGAKPYTVSNLIIGKRTQGKVIVAAGQTGWLRFTALTDAVSHYLLDLANNPPDYIQLDHKQFTVSGATVDAKAHPWAGHSTYQDLAAPYLLSGKKPSPKITLDFTSPTTFRSQGRYVPMPMPEMVFGSLLNRWQSFAPIALNPEVYRFAAEAVALSRYNIRSRGTPGKNRGMQIGFTGEVSFSALNRDPYWLNVLHLLAAFSFYSGVGYQTTAGLGQTRVGRRFGR